MDGSQIEIPLLKVKKEIILNFFKLKKNGHAICKACSQELSDNLRNPFLQNHLKLHADSWNLYLRQVADAIMDNVPKSSDIDTMKLVTLLIDEAGKEFNLQFPLSRIQRSSSNLNILEHLEGFEGRLQRDFNSSYIGPYMGPYDQNKVLKLSSQLTSSELDFEKYTQFIHSEHFKCKSFSIKESYETFGELSKIDVLEIKVDDQKSDDVKKSDDDEKSDDDDQKSDDEENDDGHIFYTCQTMLCRIPCPCRPCCSEEDQCAEHPILHDDQFDEDKHLVLIRSSDEFCCDNSFFKDCYLIKYAGIPVICTKCNLDFLHHTCYHLDFHESCKFCRKNKFKIFAETDFELKSDIKRHKNFLKTVCPHCDSKFCEPYFRKKHVEFEHEEAAPFKCGFCSTTFHSKQGKVYHESVHHTDQPKKETCSTCGKEFSAKVSLLNHIKYVHSEAKTHSCVACDAKFKQRKDMRVHILKTHGANMSKAMHGNPENEEVFQCDMCDASFKHKKHLNAHIRSKHEGTSGTQSFQCDECSLSYSEAKNLKAHKKLKHGSNAATFPCPVCGKIFNQKNNMNKHKKIHYRD